MIVNTTNPWVHGFYFSEWNKCGIICEPGKPGHFHPLSDFLSEYNNRGSSPLTSMYVICDMTRAKLFTILGSKTGILEVSQYIEWTYGAIKQRMR